MAQHQHLHQQQQATQQQIASANQVLLSTLIALPLAELAERVETELIDNEALEVAEREGEMEAWEQEQSQSEAERLDDEAGDYAELDEMPERLREAMAYDPNDEGRALQIADTEGEMDELYRQIDELNLEEEETRTLRYLAASLDEQGFLTKDAQTLSDELAFKEYIYRSAEQVEGSIARLQSLEPRGIGARSLRECLLLQLSPAQDLARKLLTHCMDELLRSDWARIQQRLRLSADQLQALRHEISLLNPRPGAALGASRGQEAPTIVPDFRVETDPEGRARLIALRGAVPELRVSPAFQETLAMHRARAARPDAPTLSRAQEEAYIYARGKVEAAQAFIETLRRRRETLHRVVESIVSLQADFFSHDDDETLLRPMVLKDVAERAGVDISTVSRAAGSKYVQTDFGIYPLRFFFSTQFAAADGEMLSARQLKAAIAELIAAEDKRQPLSDETIAATLTAEGKPLARRTVSKYREQLGLPSARLRRQS